MSVVEKIALGLTLLFLVVVCLRLFAAPLKLALKVAFNSALGFGAVWLLNLSAEHGCTAVLLRPHHALRCFLQSDGTAALPFSPLP